MGEPAPEPEREAVRELDVEGEEEGWIWVAEAEMCAGKAPIVSGRGGV